MVKPISMYCHGCGDIKFYDTPCGCHQQALPQLQWADEPSPFEQMRAAVRENVERVSLTTASGEDLDALAKSVGAKTDPWVKVGTTTIDGSVAQVGEMLRVLKAESHRDAIDAFLQADEPWLIGGRYLQAKRSHIDSHDNTALIRCDIVRRQSEIDEEEMIDEEVAYQAQRRAMPAAIRPPCPECGPHGNAGEVLLASTWVRCTLCGGGKSGDAFGAVAEAQELPRIEVEIQAVGVDALANLQRYQEVVADMTRLLCSPPPDMSREEYRALIFGETRDDAVMMRGADATDDEYRRRIRSHFGAK